MARIKGNNIIATNFEPTIQAPLDSRLVVATLADLTAPETYIAKNYYKGMTVTVQEDGSIWTLMDPENIVAIESWVKQTSGQGAKDFEVIDNLDSDSSTDVLSAGQGKVLAAKIQEVIDSKGQANGIASLGEDGKIPANQLPSYVDDVLEFDSKEDFPEVGEDGKIYVDKKTNTTWRWGGSVYASIGNSLAIGETSETAFAGDRGKALEENVEAVKDDLKNLKEKELPKFAEGVAKALDQTVLWGDEEKKTIILPTDGSIAAEKPGEDEESSEKSNLIGQIKEQVDGEEIYVTEVGSDDNELRLNSKSGKVTVGEKTVAYVEDVQENLEKIDELEKAVGKPSTPESDATGVYKAIEDNLSWYEEKVIIKWDGTTKKVPQYNSETKTYSISEASELAWLADNVPSLDDKTIVLTNDIDLNNHAWKPIGTSTGSVMNNPDVEFFRGVFDGKRHVIKNLSCEISDDFAKVGLFGAFQGTVKNLVIDGANLKSTHYTGAFVPYNNGLPCVIENCEARNITILDTPALNVDGEMDNGDKAGTIAGYISSTGSKITGCKVSNSFIKAYRDLGGIVGYVGLSNITVEISNNTLRNVNLIQDVTNGYKDYSKVKGHAGSIYGWKDNNTVNSSNNVGEANVIVIGSPE